ncbi:MAG: TetR/AcrR family transcriptional regulator [Acidimicrobiales bacterium]|nr:TetR/AcrR family transcriptional regulator [Acidimicrobiales bacterium]
MSGTTNSPRIAARRQATRAEILAAAWTLAQEQGLAGLSLRELGNRVGMRAQSLYGYFGSKNDIYDAMFADGWRALLAEGIWPGPEAPVDRERFKAGARQFVAFCLADPVRFQLLFQRTIPGFEPSAESYAVALEVLTGVERASAALGITDPAHLDLQTALISGLISQQIANDPGGDRWVRLLDEALDMYLDHVLTDDRPDRNAS